jgi:O-antigen/teichoic acid export membrane protein
MPQLKRRLSGRVRSLGGTTVALIASQVAMGVSGVLAARTLGPEGRGVVTAVLAWPMILGWFSLAGLNLSATVRTAGTRAGLTTTLGNALAHSLVVGGAVSIVAIALVPAALAHLGPNAAELAVWTLATIPTVVLADILMSINVALGRVALANWCRVISPVLVLAGTLVLLARGAVTPEWIVAITVGSGIVALAVAGVGLPWRRIAVSFTELRSDLRFGLKGHLAALINLANVRLDLLLMSAFVSSAQVGFYGVANNLMMPVSSVGAAAAILLMPRVAAMARADSPLEVDQDQLASIREDRRRFLVVSIAGGAALAAVLPFAVPLLFGQAFEPVVVLAWVLIPGYIARTYASLIAAGTIGARRPWVANVTEGAGLVVTFALLPVLLPRYEALGAAVTSTAAYTASALTGCIAMRRLERQARSASRLTAMQSNEAGAPAPLPVQSGG